MLHAFIYSNLPNRVSQNPVHIAGFLQVRENCKRSGNLSGQGKCKSDWKVREMFGKIIRSDNFQKKKVSDRDMIGVRTNLC